MNQHLAIKRHDGGFYHDPRGKLVLYGTHERQQAESTARLVTMLSAGRKASVVVVVIRLEEVSDSASEVCEQDTMSL